MGVIGSPLSRRGSPEEVQAPAAKHPLALGLASTFQRPSHWQSRVGVLPCHKLANRFAEPPRHQAEGGSGGSGAPADNKSEQSPGQSIERASSVGSIVRPQWESRVVGPSGHGPAWPPLSRASCWRAGDERRTPSLRGLCAGFEEKHTLKINQYRKHQGSTHGS